jgi:D-glycero-alpha-D-manno-heptose-7-phosphate kinase
MCLVEQMGRLYTQLQPGPLRKIEFSCSGDIASYDLRPLQAALIKGLLESGDIRRFGDLMHEHWMRKRARSDGMTNQGIDDLYDLARTRGGATGGKLVGAGGSGFLLFQTNDRRHLRETMAEAGLSEMDFSFDFDGSVVLLRNH